MFTIKYLLIHLDISAIHYYVRYKLSEISLKNIFLKDKSNSFLLLLIDSMSTSSPIDNFSMTEDGTQGGSPAEQKAEILFLIQDKNDGSAELACKEKGNMPTSSNPPVSVIQDVHFKFKFSHIHFLSIKGAPISNFQNGHSRLIYNIVLLICSALRFSVFTSCNVQ